MPASDASMNAPMKSSVGPVVGKLAVVGILLADDGDGFDAGVFEGAGFVVGDDTGDLVAFGVLAGDEEVFTATGPVF